MSRRYELVEDSSFWCKTCQKEIQIDEVVHLIKGTDIKVHYPNKGQPPHVLEELRHG